MKHLSGILTIVAGTDDQTFSMALPGKLRNYYDKVVTPATSIGSGSAAGQRGQSLTGTAVQQIVQAYGTMNNFLTRFLEHVRSVILLLNFDSYSKVSNKRTVQCTLINFLKNPPCTLLLKTCKLFQHH